MVKSNHDGIVYLKQLLDAIHTIDEFVGSMNMLEFSSDKKTFHACLMVLVHIGEIFAKMQRNNIDIKLSDSQKIIDMRNFLAH